jgi:hypothetical protein
MKSYSMSIDPTNFIIDHHTVNRQERDRINRIHNINWVNNQKRKWLSLIIETNRETGFRSSNRIQTIYLLQSDNMVKQNSLNRFGWV